MANQPPQFPGQQPQRPFPQQPYQQRPGMPQKSGGNKTLWIVLGILGGVLGLMLLVCGGCTIWLYSVGSSAIEEVVEEAKKNSSQQNLRQVGLAIHNYHATNKTFPALVSNDGNGTAKSWRVAVNEFAGKPKPNAPPALQPKSGADLFHSAADGGNSSDTSFMAVTGEKTAFGEPGGSARGFRHVLDGTTNTIMVIEVHNTGQPWNEPGDLTVDEAVAAIRNSTGPTNCLFADGSTRRVSNTVSEEVLRDLFIVDDGNIHTPDKYSR